MEKTSLLNENIKVCFDCYKAEGMFKSKSKKKNEKNGSSTTTTTSKEYPTREAKRGQQIIDDVLTAGILSAAKMKHDNDELKKENSTLKKNMGYVKRTNNYLQENISKKRKLENISKKRHGAVIEMKEAAHNSIIILWKQTRQRIKQGGTLTNNARLISEVLKLLSELMVWSSGLPIRRVEDSLGMSVYLLLSYIRAVFLLVSLDD